MVEAVVNADRLPLGAAAFRAGLAALATATAPPAAAAAPAPAGRAIAVFTRVGIRCPRLAGLAQRFRIAIADWLAVAVLGSPRESIVVGEWLGAAGLGLGAVAAFDATVGGVLPLPATAATASAAAASAARAIFLAVFAVGPRSTFQFAVCHRPRRLGPVLESVAAFLGVHRRPLDRPWPHGGRLRAADPEFGGQGVPIALGAGRGAGRPALGARRARRLGGRRRLRGRLTRGTDAERFSQ